MNGETEREYSNDVLSHVADDTVSLAGASVVGRLSIPENFQSAESPIIKRKAIA